MTPTEGTQYDPTRKRTIIISRVVTTVQRLEFTPEYYPGMTLEEAVVYERDSFTEQERLEIFLDMVEAGIGDPVMSLSVWTNDEPAPQG